MIAKATYAACLFINNKTGVKAIINSNFSSDKKNSSRNEHTGYGKSLFAEFTLPQKVIQ